MQLAGDALSPNGACKADGGRLGRTLAARGHLAASLAPQRIPRRSQRPHDILATMLGPFSSPLAKHLHRAAVSSTADGSHRLSFGSGNGGPPPPQQRTPPGSISSIQVGPSPGEPLGVHSPTASPAARSRLAQASGPGDAPPSPSRQPPPPLLPTAPPDSPAAALQQLAVSKQRSAVAAAAAAMQSPAPAARPGQLRPLSAAGGTPRSGAAAFSTPLASSRPQLFAAPAAAAASPAPPSSAGSAQQQQQAPRSSFKQQAQQLQQQPPLQVGLTPGSGLGSAQRPRPRALVQQQQQTPPPAASLEEAMGQLQLQGSLAAAAATPGLKMRSRGERWIGPCIWLWSVARCECCKPYTHIPPFLPTASSLPCTQACSRRSGRPGAAPQLPTPAAHPRPAAQQQEQQRLRRPAPPCCPQPSSRRPSRSRCGRRWCRRRRPARRRARGCWARCTRGHGPAAPCTTSAAAP